MYASCLVMFKPGHPANKRMACISGLRVSICFPNCTKPTTSLSWALSIVPAIVRHESQSRVGQVLPSTCSPPTRCKSARNNSINYCLSIIKVLVRGTPTNKMQNKWKTSSARAIPNSTRFSLWKCPRYWVSIAYMHVAHQPIHFRGGEWKLEKKLKNRAWTEYSTWVASTGAIKHLVHCQSVLFKH